MLLSIYYIVNSNKGQTNNKVVIERENAKEMDKLKKLRSIQLTQPLTEKSRPTNFDEIIGQEEGIKALKLLYVDQILSMLLFTDLQG